MVLQTRGESPHLSEEEQNHPLLLRLLARATDLFERVLADSGTPPLFYLPDAAETALAQRAQHSVRARADAHARALDQHVVARPRAGAVGDHGLGRSLLLPGVGFGLAGRRGRAT